MLQWHVSFGCFFLFISFVSGLSVRSVNFCFSKALFDFFFFPYKLHTYLRWGFSSEFCSFLGGAKSRLGWILTQNCNIQTDTGNLICLMLVFVPQILICYVVEA